MNYVEWASVGQYIENATLRNAVLLDPTSANTIVWDNALLLYKQLNRYFLGSFTIVLGYGATYLNVKTCTVKSLNLDQ